MATFICPAESGGHAAAVQSESSAVQFMQTEHTRVLAELKEEIKLLRQRNADLTMQVTCNENFAHQSDAAAAELAASRGETEAVRQQLRSEIQETESLRGQFAQSLGRVSALESEAEASLEHTQTLGKVIAEQNDAAQHAHEVIRTLRSEVDERSANSANLMVQLHKAKVQYKQFVDRQSVDGGMPGAVAPSPPRPSAPRPSPPRSSALNHVRTRVVRRRATTVTGKAEHGSAEAGQAAAAYSTMGAVRSPVRATRNVGADFDNATFRERRGDTAEEDASLKTSLPAFSAVPPIMRTLPATPSLEQR